MNDGALTIMQDAFDVCDGEAEAGAAHPLLGRELDVAGVPGRHYENTLSLDQPWFIAQHRMFGAPVLPVAAVIEWALAALGQDTVQVPGALVLRQVELKAVAMFGERGAIVAQLAIKECEAGCRIRCFGRDAGAGRGGWIEYAGMDAQHAPAVSTGASICIDELKKTLQPQEIAACHEFWRRRGLQCGPAFRGLRSLWLGGNQALAHIQVSLPESDAQVYRMHPVLLETCFQSLFVFSSKMPVDTVLLPVGVERLCSIGRSLPASLWCRMTWHGGQDAGRCSADLDLFCDAGELLAALHGVQLAPMPVPLSSPGTTIVQACDTKWLPLALDADAIRPTQNVCRLIYCADLTAAINLQGECGVHGQAAVTIFADTCFKRVDASIFGVDPHSTQDLERLFATLKAEQLLVRGVMFLDTGDIALRSKTNLIDRSYRLAQIGFSVLRNFLSAYADSAPEIMICWRGACSAARPEGMLERLSEAGLARSVLNDLGRALIAEYPHIKCLQVDLDPLAALPPVPILLAAIEQLGGVGQIALRGGQWYQAHQTQADTRLPVRPASRETLLEHLI